MASTNTLEEVLIDMVRACPCLYSLKHESYHVNAIKERQWREIEDCLRTMGFLWKGDIKVRWKTLKDYYGRLKKTENNKKRSGAETSCQVKWAHYLAMQFMDDCTTKQSTSGNLAAMDTLDKSKATSSAIVCSATPIEYLCAEEAPNEEIEQFGTTSVEPPESPSLYSDHIYTPLPNDQQTSDTFPLRRRRGVAKRIRIDTDAVSKVLGETTAAIDCVRQSSTSQEPQTLEEVFGEFVAKNLAKMAEIPRKKMMLDITTMLLTAT